MENKIGILGYGEVGIAVAKLYEGSSYYVVIKDKEKGKDDNFSDLGILHVCIPWSDDFISCVSEAIKIHTPTITIIHGTVPVGTTDKIQEGLKEGRYVVFSPVRGVHPNLLVGILTFDKYIGGTKKGTELAKEHLDKLGITTRTFNSSRSIELGKLLSTTYYGLLIAWHGEMEKICKEAGVPFSVVVEDFNESYNRGYTALGRKDVVRPTLTPPEDGIGGHCIIFNTEILALTHSSLALDLILKYKKKP